MANYWGKNKKKTMVKLIYSFFKLLSSWQPCTFSMQSYCWSGKVATRSAAVLYLCLTSCDSIPFSFFSVASSQSRECRRACIHWTPLVGGGRVDQAKNLR